MEKTEKKTFAARRSSRVACKFPSVSFYNTNTRHNIPAIKFYYALFSKRLRQFAAANARQAP